MRINLNGAATSQIDTERKTSKVAGGQGHLLSTEDKTTLSVDTTAINSLSSQALQMPAIRQEKVAALGQSVSNGTYQIDPGKIADSILDENTK